MSHFRHLPVMSAKLLAQPVWRAVSAQSINGSSSFGIIIVLSRNAPLNESLNFPCWSRYAQKFSQFQDMNLLHVSNCVLFIKIANRLIFICTFSDNIGLYNMT